MEPQTDKFTTIADNLHFVQDRIAGAAIKAGRRPEDITLIGVTKTQPPEAVRELILAGATHIGENRVQELLGKETMLSDLTYTPHIIGSLQRNKTKYLPGHVKMVQSVDSIKLADALEKAFASQNMQLDVLIEVNIGEEATKSGISKNQIFELVEYIQSQKTLRLRGLMAIPPFGLGEKVRIYFQQMYQLFIDIQAKKMDNENVNILSMGMSDDFEYAILEGSTMVRVGTKLFGPRIY